ncbi:MAG TPA: heavy metal sensor histidine kinase [Candidatus Acidoferrales bacterium]|nr:heavy metal sensor histidine kinase [Candidatus Acidoferrales bacterium]
MKALSIGARLTAWYSLMLALSLGLFGAFAYFAMDHSIRATVDSELHHRLQAVSDIIKDDMPQGLPAVQDEFSELLDSEGTDALLRVSNQNGLVIYASAAIQKGVEPRPGHKAGRPFNASMNGEWFRFLREPVDVAGATYDIEVGASTAQFIASLDRFRDLLYALAPVFLVFAALGGYWLSRRALAPVDQITRAARTIGAQDLSQRLVAPRASDELQRLASTLNEMLARIETAFQRVRQFTADASHELRTPVSVMRTNAEIVLRKPRSEAEYREALSRILDESEKVSRMIEQLLLLARADSAAELLPMTRNDLATAFDVACREARVLAEAKNVNFQASVPPNALWVQGDSASLERLFMILLDNAVKYTAPGGHIDVHLGSDDGFAVADIRDTGTGIAPEDISHVFDRFYRADRARSRESGGTGLGLAIGRWIAEAHRGEIRVESAVGKGSTFQVRIPLLRD